MSPTMEGEEHGLSVFFRLDDDVFHTYSRYARGTEWLTDAYSLLDTTPYGRQQDGKILLPVGHSGRRMDRPERSLQRQRARLPTCNPRGGRRS